MSGSATDTAPAGRATFPHGLRAEWIKIRTMRSTIHVILGTLAFCVGLASLNGTSAGGEYGDMTAADQASFDPLATSLRGYLLAQIALGLLGALVITSEYGARTIVSTLTAVPHRARVLAAKATVLVAVVLPVGLLVSFSGFLVGQAALAGADAPHLGLSDPQALRGILGGGLYLTLAGLFGLAIGAVVRSTTATVTTLFGALLIVQAFAPALPGALGDRVAKYWPPLAGGQIITGYRDPALLAPWSGLAVMAGCVAALLTAAFIVFRKRDA
ncbi:ABC transporter permease [Streptomyces melanosporofaciens]|uniref:ABC-type transport system involved in multi-copper enzyme maturation, permease component n=1 Tax=Streptomyces melanosporofaciens TaxID=67327 RepID=A0A1H4ZTV2_STRMJ|nr:ABC transporter permease [Streptomyces melanosporofaciens]SED33533.1 ABC-type transport system involved in multi-copper enzyme maturation, permease component [Streptomyces melanosporofaciens]